MRAVPSPSFMFSTERNKLSLTLSNNLMEIILVG